MSERRRGDLNELSIFVRVAQLGSFSAAARSLDMPISTVSRKISELESRLGVTLIKRTTRKLNLSEQGLSFYESCAPHLQGLEEAEAGLTSARAELEGALRVTAPVALGRGEFVDFISGFSKRYPRLRIDLTITNQFVDLVATQVDVAIRFGALADSGALARRLGASQRMLAASPEYLKQRGTPRSPRELSEHDCVVFRGETEGADWNLHAGRRRARARVAGPVSANNFESVNELAIRGHGIALLPEPFVLAGSSAGSLRRVLPRWTSAPVPVHAVYLARKFVPAKLQTFLAELSRFQNSTWREQSRS